MVDKARTMPGGNEHALLQEAKGKFMRTENGSREYRFFGAIINEISHPLKDRLEKKLRKEAEAVRACQVEEK